MIGNVQVSGRRVENPAVALTLPAQGSERSKPTQRGFSLERAFLCLERFDNCSGPLMLWFRIWRQKRGGDEPYSLKEAPTIDGGYAANGRFNSSWGFRGLGFPDVR